MGRLVYDDYQRCPVFLSFGFKGWVIDFVCARNDDLSTAIVDC